jgi:SAM-dependent methyltransferase
METDLIKLHRAAEETAPDARLEERDAALARLQLTDKHVVCDVPAWGGYFSRGVVNPARVICLDPTPAIVNCPGAKVIGSGPLEHSLRTASVDRLVSLVGLHHHPRPQMYVKESFRVLRSTGVAVFSEVLAASPVAVFLNEDVDRYAQRGHKGIFLPVGGLASLLTTAGFQSVVEEVVNLKWRFDNTLQMTRFVMRLFAMVKATDMQVQTALEKCFTITNEGGKVCLPWPLVYGVGVKP